MISQTRKMMLITMLVAIGIVFHILESMVTIPLAIPGFRLGFANIVGMVALYVFTPNIMFGVNTMRVIFASLLSGTLFGTGFWLSLFGMLFSNSACIVFKKLTPMSMYGVSVMGSVFHAIGQVIIVTFLYQQFFMQAVLPILLLLGIPTGLLVAYMAEQICKRLSKIENKGE